MALRLGIFLYPTLIFFLSGEMAFSRLSFSNLSAVKGSPPPATASFEGVVDGDDDDNCEGDVERVVGTFTVIESPVDAVVAMEALEPVLSANAARRGRGAAVVAGLPLVGGLM